ncbi:glycine-rich cell wall structural protein 1 [Colletotrichum truncatum]|uniref:Glycine-rich cell wall structural protein 1 n=1 Tax=Colletotrichum truncatum TaxID=5467 RepID=A0ACC3YFW1_COLTU|nr:glycine-rich cell wall structural protein 1 [Colletotrichum truncatum]KAF6784551.1 glycine-rich cell wall structural protein 1 [Colletotrichum truncatum]
METINNMATAATKAIWGTNEAKEEPISGVRGNTNNGEPYDAGNIEDPQKKADTVGASNESSTATSTTSGVPVASSSATEHPTRHKADIGKPELNDRSPEDAAPHDSAAGKTDTRHPTDPATDPKPEGQDVSTESGTGPTNKGDKLDGPGPRPLEAVAKERGGDAGNISGSSHSGLAAGEASEEEDGPQNKSHGEGTGEKYIKSTGLAADGGDFDATKPGAGREADRLLDEKDPAAAAARAAAAKPGSHNTTDNNNSGSKHSSNSGVERTHSPNDGSEKEKKSLGDKIKAKLHRH